MKSRNAAQVSDVAKPPQQIKRAMKRGFLFLGSPGCQPVVVGSLPTSSQRGASTHRYQRSMSFSAGCRKRQASSLCSPERSLARSEKFTTAGTLIIILMIWLGIFSKRYHACKRSPNHTGKESGDPGGEIESGASGRAAAGFSFRRLASRRIGRASRCSGGSPRW